MVMSKTRCCWKSMLGACILLGGCYCKKEEREAQSSSSLRPILKTVKDDGPSYEQEDCMVVDGKLVETAKELDQEIEWPTYSQLGG